MLDESLSVKRSVESGITATNAPRFVFEVQPVSIGHVRVFYHRKLEQGQ